MSERVEIYWAIEMQAGWGDSWVPLRGAWTEQEARMIAKHPEYRAIRVETISTRTQTRTVEIWQ